MGEEQRGPLGVSIESRQIAAFASPLIQSLGGSVPAGVIVAAEKFAAAIERGDYVGAIMQIANVTLGPAGQLLGLAVGVGRIRGVLKDVAYQLDEMSQGPMNATTWRSRAYMTLHKGVTLGGQDPEYGPPPRDHAWRGDRWISTRTSVGIDGPLKGFGLASVTRKRISLGFNVKATISVPRFVYWHEQRPGEPTAYWDTPPKPVRL